jgi:hypothetical protein
MQISNQDANMFVSPMVFVYWIIYPKQRTFNLCFFSVFLEFLWIVTWENALLVNISLFWFKWCNKGYAYSYILYTKKVDGVRSGFLQVFGCYFSDTWLT